MNYRGNYVVSFSVYVRCGVEVEVRTGKVWCWGDTAALSSLAGWAVDLAE